MNKLFKKIAAAFIGMAMAVGVSVAIGKGSVHKVFATPSTIMTFDFEDDGAHRTSGSNSYNGTNEYSENNVDISLTNTDSVTSGTPINGSANLLGRVAASSTTSCSVLIGPIDLSNYNVTGISYKIQGVSSMSILGQYSVNGTSWTNLESSSSCPSSITTKSYQTLSIEEPESFYFKLTVSVSSSTKSKRDYQFDDLVITGESTSTKSLDSISCSNQEIEVTSNVNLSTQLSFDPQDAANKNVSYLLKSGDDCVDLDTETGVVLGVKSGLAIVTITPEDTNADPIDVTITVNAISAPTITIGDQFVIYAEDTTGKSELSSINTSNNFGVATAFTGDAPAKTYVLDTEDGYFENTVAFKNGSNYLALNSGANQLHVGTTVNANTSWIVSFDETTGDAQLNNGAYPARSIQFNRPATGDPRFACYATEQVAIKMYKIQPVVLSSIEVTSEPTKTVYEVDEEFNPAGLAVKAIYSDAHENVLASNEYSLSTPDMSTPGQKIITVTYIDGVEKTTTFNITVNQPKVYHTVTLKAGLGEGEDVLVNNIEEGDSYELPACPQQFTAPSENHEFSGWLVNDENTLREVGYEITVEADTIVTAQWAETQQPTPNVNVTFDIGYDNGPEPTIVPVEVGTPVNQPEDPVRAGYTFLGWFLGQESEPFDFAQNITEAITLVAHWEAEQQQQTNYYTVTYSDGQDNPGTHEFSGVEEGSYELLTLDMSGVTAPSVNHQFLGWKVNGLGETLNPGDSINLTSNVTIVAQWQDATPAPTPASLVVTFSSPNNVNPKVGETLDDIQGEFIVHIKLTDNTVQDADVAEECEYYILNGQQEVPVGPTTVFETAGELTVYARFTGNLATPITGSATITVDPAPVQTEEVNAVMAKGTAYSYDDVVVEIGNDTISAIKIGSSSQPGNMTITVPANASSLSFYAVGWKSSSGTTITFSGATVAPASVTLTGDDGATANSPFAIKGADVEAYKFTVALSGITTQTAITLTGSARAVIWGAKCVIPKGSATYTVTYDSNGGSAVQPETVTFGGKATKPTDPTFEGHTFDGWFLGNATTAFDFNTVITGNITLQAKWTEVPQTITPTEVSLNKTTETVEAGSTVTLTATLAPEGATGTVTWLTSDATKATVANGVVTGVAAGEATIIAFIDADGDGVADENELKAQCVVTVTAAQGQGGEGQGGEGQGQGGQGETPVEAKVDVLDFAFTGVTADTTTGNNDTNVHYENWSGKEGTSGAVYAGNSRGGWGSTIQLRSNNSNSGIVVTSGCNLNVATVEIKFNSNTAAERTVDIYGKDTAYTGAEDLYAAGTQGTKLGSIVMGGTTSKLVVTGEYKFIGLRSASSALYIDSIRICWGADVPEETPATLTGITLNKTTTSIAVGANETLTATLAPEGATGTVTWLTSDATKATVANGVVTGVAAGTATITAFIDADGDGVVDENELKAECLVTVTAASGGEGQGQGGEGQGQGGEGQGGQGETPAATVVRISVTGIDKVDYTKGQELDLSKLVVMIVYSDGTAVQATADQIKVSGYDANKLGQQDVVISVGDQSYTVKVMVTDQMGCHGSIVAGSALISITTLLGAGLLMLKKRKED